MTDKSGESTLAEAEASEKSFVHFIYETRIDCSSVVAEMPVKRYLKIVKGAHANQGGIEGQRAVHVTTTARRNRLRVISDPSKGAVLPPIVIGSSL